MLAQRCYLKEGNICVDVRFSTFGGSARGEGGHVHELITTASYSLLFKVVAKLFRLEPFWCQGIFSWTGLYDAEEGLNLIVLFLVFHNF